MPASPTTHPSQPAPRPARRAPARPRARPPVRLPARLHTRPPWPASPRARAPACPARAPPPLALRAIHLAIGDSALTLRSPQFSRAPPVHWQPSGSDGGIRLGQPSGCARQPGSKSRVHNFIDVLAEELCLSSPPPPSQTKPTARWGAGPAGAIGLRAVNACPSWLESRQRSRRHCRGLPCYRGVPRHKSFWAEIDQQCPLASR